MLELFSSIQFAYPLALLSGILVPLLVFAYLRKKTKKRLTVSSILILEKLSKRRMLRRRFKPPLRFYLELLALLLLCLASALPSKKDLGTRIALVLDNSLSMRTKSRDPQTRFDQGLIKAKEWLRDQSSSSTYSLYFSSPKLTRVGKPASSRAASMLRIGSIEASFSSDTLDISIVELAESGEYDKVVVFTDREADFIESSEDELKDSTDKAAQIEVVHLGEPRSNLFVADLQIKDSGLKASASQLVASVGLCGVEAIDVLVKLFRVELLGRMGAKSEELLRSTTVRAQPDEAVKATLQLAKPLEEGQVFKLEISPKDSGEVLTANALLEDDFAWVAAGASGSAEVLLISPQSSIDALGLAQIPSLRVAHVSPAEFAKLDTPAVNQYALLVFHQSAPAAAPRRPTLLILPPEENSLFTSTAKVNKPRITSWQSDHPITSYLKVPLLTPTISLLFEVPLWAQSIINVEPGSILVAGESRGIRFAAVGFEMFPFEGTRTPGLSILALNLINWLSGSSELGSGLLSGANLRLEPGKKWIIRRPDGESESVNVAEDEIYFFTFKRPGPYHFSGVRRGGELKTERSTRIYTVNSFYPGESSTCTASFLVVPKSVQQEQIKRKTEQSLWDYLLALALALVLIELLIHFFQKEAKSSSTSEGEG